MANNLGSTLIYAGIGASLGLLVGITMASEPWAQPSPAPHTTQQVSTAAPVSRPVPTVVKAPPAIVPVVEAASVKAPAVVSPAVAKIPVAATAPHKAVTRTRAAIHQIAFSKAKRKPSAELAAAGAAATAASVSQAAEQDRAAVANTFRIQGDVTVADFDATSGTIETYERKTFVLDKTAGSSDGVSWDEGPVNVHYSCDQGGTCTLSHAGTIIPNAKLAL